MRSEPQAAATLPLEEPHAPPAKERNTLRGSLPVLLGLAVLYLPTWLDLARGPWQDESHAHGPILLALAAWLAWRERAAFAGPAAAGALLAGSALLALGLALYALGRSQQVALFEVGSQVPVFAGSALLLAGWRCLGRLWLALAFVALAVPLPGFLVELVTGPLKSLVSQLAETILFALGYPIARTGVALSIGQYQLLLADACAGLNSIAGLAALGLLYLYLTGIGSPARAACLLVAIVPIALAANFVRTLLLLLITFHLGDEAGQGFLHSLTGIVLFATALALLLAFDLLLRRLPSLRRALPGP